MKGTLTLNGQKIEATSEDVLAAFAGTDHFWLDLDDSTQDGTVAELLGVHFKFHPLAVAAAKIAVPGHGSMTTTTSSIWPCGCRPARYGGSRGPLLLDRSLYRHRAPGRLPVRPGRAQPDRSAPHRHQQCVATDRHRLSDHERIRGRLLPGPGRFRRQDRRLWRTTSSNNRRRPSWASSST